jgi:hypothetical protein
MEFTYADTGISDIFIVLQLTDYFHAITQVSFRPEVQGWGDKALLYCANIIDMIPPENEVDLLMHGNVVPQSLETKEQLIHSKLEEPDEEDLVQVKKELEFDVIGMKGDAGGFEKTREDVFEGFWEAEYDDEY